MCSIGKAIGSSKISGFRILTIALMVSMALQLISYFISQFFQETLDVFSYFSLIIIPLLLLVLLNLLYISVKNKVTVKNVLLFSSVFAIYPLVRVFVFYENNPTNRILFSLTNIVIQFVLLIIVGYFASFKQK